jgi:hypothetical protein
MLMVPMIPFAASPLQLSLGAAALMLALMSAVLVWYTTTY